MPAVAARTARTAIVWVRWTGLDGIGGFRSSAGSRPVGIELACSFDFFRCHPASTVAHLLADIIASSAGRRRRVARADRPRAGRRAMPRRPCWRRPRDKRRRARCRASAEQSVADTSRIARSICRPPLRITQLRPFSITATLRRKRAYSSRRIAPGFNHGHGNVASGARSESDMPALYRVSRVLQIPPARGDDR